MTYAPVLLWDQDTYGILFEIIPVHIFLSRLVLFLTGFPGNTHLINHLHRAVSGDDNQRHHIICQMSLTNKNQSQCPVFLLSVICWYHGLIWDVFLISAEKQGSLWLDFLSLERKKVSGKKAYEIVPSSMFFILWWVYSYRLLDKVTCIY